MHSCVTAWHTEEENGNGELTFTNLVHLRSHEEGGKTVCPPTTELGVRSQVGLKNLCSSLLTSSCSIVNAHMQTQM
jgi:hypothetical protein